MNLAKPLLIIVLILFIFFVIFVVKQPMPLLYQEADKPACSFIFPEKTSKKGYLKYISGIPVLVVSGSPQEIGEQVTNLAVMPSKKAHGYPKEMFDKYALGGALIKKFTWNKLIRTGEKLLANSNKEYQTEVNEVAKGMGRDLAVASNTLFDIKNTMDIGVKCSAIVVLPNKSEKVLFGRNLDYPSNGYLHNYTLITVYKPNNKKSFVSVAFPGLVGCITGMNQDGLCVAVLEIKSVKKGVTRFDSNGVPYALCYRKILEECSNVEDLRRLLPGLKFDTAVNLITCDKKQSSVFEITPNGYDERESKNNICTCTNHFCSIKFKPSQESALNSIDRLECLDKMSSKDKINIPDLHQVLDEVSLSDTLQTMVLEPESLAINIACGAIPAAKLPLRRISFDTFLRK